MVAATLVVAVAPSTTGAPAAFAAPARALVADCPAAVPLAGVTAGMVGEGWTVVRGSTPEAFKVTVLGVIPDAWGVGKAGILVEVADLDGGHVIDQAGGIWSGMSGSPVYVGDQLLGAVSGGYTLAASPIGIVTPAQDMYDLLDLTSSTARRAPDRQEVRLSKALRRSAAARATSPIPSGDLQQLPIPLSVSGLSSARLAELRKHAAGAGVVNPLVAGTAAAAPQGDAVLTTPRPGGNLVGAISYGDLSLYGTGTTTAVCDGMALGFGHPLTAAGAVSYGASDADVISIINDRTLGAFKMSNPTTPIGTLDEDRGSGIRVDLSAAPPVATVTSTVRNGDTGRSRTGVTTVTDQTWLAGIAAFATYANFGNVFDEIGDGRATSRWTITGTRADGQPFTVSRYNRFSSRYDITEEPSFDVAYVLDLLTSNELENVRVDTVSIDSWVSTKFQQLRIVDAAVSVKGGAYKKPSRVRVSAGDTVKVRVTLKGFRSAAAETRTLSMTVPASAAGKQGVLSVVGGASSGGGFDEEEGDDIGCLLSPETCGDTAESLDAQLKAVVEAPHNNDLTAQLLLIDPESEDGDPSVTDTTKRQRFTVRGSENFQVVVRG